MSYYLSKILPLPFDAAVVRTTDALKEEGFGVITDIDIRETLKKKIGIDFPSYRILGACNPALAYEALQLENKVGTMLPCNVVVYEGDDGAPWSSRSIRRGSWRRPATRSSSRWRTR